MKKTSPWFGFKGAKKEPEVVKRIRRSTVKERKRREVLLRWRVYIDGRDIHWVVIADTAQQAYRKAMGVLPRWVFTDGDKMAVRRFQAYFRPRR